MLKVIGSTLVFVVSILAALFALMQARQATDTEARVVISDFLSRFNGAEMSKARATLVGYSEFLTRHRKANVTDVTEENLAYFVYPTADREPGDLLSNFPLMKAADKDKEEFARRQSFFMEFDRSRRRIKNFYDDVRAFACNDFFRSRHSWLWPLSYLETDRVMERLLMERFGEGAGRFLEKYWLAVEKGQNKALYKDDPKEVQKRDQQAEDLVAWYKGGMARSSCPGRGASPATSS